jgi:hypothetical protein
MRSSGDRHDSGTPVPLRGHASARSGVLWRCHRGCDRTAAGVARTGKIRGIRARRGLLLGRLRRLVGAEPRQPAVVSFRRGGGSRRVPAVEGARVRAAARDCAHRSPPRRQSQLRRVLDQRRGHVHLRGGSRIRLLIADAPEAGQGPYADSATLLLKRLMPVGSSVRLEFDVQVRDRYRPFQGEAREPVQVPPRKLFRGARRHVPHGMHDQGGRWWAGSMGESPQATSPARNTESPKATRTRAAPVRWFIATMILPGGWAGASARP